MISLYCAGYHRLFLLEDGCSSVKDFEKEGADFLETMKSKGVNVVKCVNLFEKLGVPVGSHEVKYTIDDILKKLSIA